MHSLAEMGIMADLGAVLWEVYVYKSIDRGKIGRIKDVYKSIDGGLQIQGPKTGRQT